MKLTKAGWLVGYLLSTIRCNILKISLPLEEDPFLSMARDEHQLKMKVLKLKEWKLMLQSDNMGIGLPPAYVNEEEDS